MKQMTRKLIAWFLSVSMVLTIGPATIFAASDYNAQTGDYYKVISQKNWELAPGIDESEIVLNNDAGDRRQVLHVIEADVNNEYTKVVPSSKGMVPTPGQYGVQTMDKQAAYAEENGYGNVVAAMNISLSWYDSDYYTQNPELVGEPLGYLILDGVQYTNSQGQTSGAQTCLVINYDEKDGVARPADIPKTQIRSTSDTITGWEEQVIPANFGFLVKDGELVTSNEDYTSAGAPRSMLGIKEDGTIVMVMNDGRQSPYSEGLNSYEMGEVMLNLGCVYAINGDGGGSSQFFSQRPGEELEMHCSPSDGGLRSTTHGVLAITTAPSNGEFVRAHIEAEDNYYTPGSSVQFKATGSDIAGGAADIPTEASWQVTEGMGTIDETGLFVSNGQAGEVTAELVYNDEVVGSATVNIVIPDEIKFQQSVITVSNGKSTTLKIKAIYDGIHEVVIKASDFDFSLDNENVGAIDGFTFTATEDLSISGGNITATLVHDNEKTATAEIRLGKASEVIWDFENGIDDWDMTMWKADASSRPYAYFARSSAYSVDATNGKVHDGNKALALDYDFTYGNSTSWNSAYLNYYGEDIKIENAQAIGCWVYVPDEIPYIEFSLRFYPNGATSPKNALVVYSDPDEVCEPGWKYVSFDISSYDYIEFKSGYQFIQVYYAGIQGVSSLLPYAGLNSNITYYIDNVTIDYSTAVADREAPVFTSASFNNIFGILTEMKGQDVSDNSLTFEAEVNDFESDNATGIEADTAKAFVDGNAVSCKYANGRITTSEVELANGVHTIKFEIADGNGNVGSISRQINVQGDSTTPTINIVPHDAELDRLPLGSIYYVDINATDIEKVDKVVTTLDLDNYSKWELDHMDVAEGFKASYEIDATNPVDNIATITIERTGETDNTGEMTLVSLPIRAWEYNPDPEKYPWVGTEYEETAEARWNDKFVFRTILGVETVSGTLTTSGESIVPFGAERIEVDTELYANSCTAIPCEELFEGKDLWHEHTATPLEDKAATCTEDGYTGRTFCEECNSVVDWGTTEEATGHDWQVVDGKLTCQNGGELFNGEYTDGKTYVDGLVIADGWIEINDVKLFYYEDGVRLTGSHIINDVMCTFDEEGIYLPDYIYEGLYKVNDTAMYFVGNKYVTGAQKIANEIYYFDENGFGYDGEYVICGEKCTFDDGKYVSCSTALLYDAGWCGDAVEYVVYKDGLLKLDGKGSTYSYANNGSRPFISCLKYIDRIEVGKNITQLQVQIFAYTKAKEVAFEEGSKLKYIGSGALAHMYNLESINIPEGVLSIDDIAFKCNYALKRVKIPTSVTKISGTAFKECNSELVLFVEENSYAETYAKDKGITYSYESYIKVGFYEENGELYYYKDDVKWTQRGVFKVGDDYYYAKSNGGLLRNTTEWASITNDLVPKAIYDFDENGKMNVKNGFYEENGELYYYKDGVKWTQRGVFKVGDDYYYAKSNGGLLRNTTEWASITNDLVPKAKYDFDENGKMNVKNGFVEEDGELYYYKDGVKWTQRGVFKVDNDYYYAKSGGALLRNTTEWASITNDLIPKAIYDFDENGKMNVKNGFVEEDGELYYYEDGMKWTTRGVFKVGEYYYYAKSGGALLRNTTEWASITNDLIPKAIYEFDEDGRIII